MSKLNTDFKMLIPDTIVSVIQLIENNGFEAFIVGGAIRDLLLGRVPKEFDLATNALPDQVENMFDAVSIEGKPFGTIRVHYDGQLIEITTFRQESGYDDFRHPNHVDFVNNIESDLKRRDFTINAMAYNPINDTLIDLFNGQDDLSNRLIRCVGDPFNRFKEDTLRVCRCFRFMSQLGFRLDLNTRDAISLALSFDSPSIERIRREMDRLLMGPYWLSSLNLMHQTGWLKKLFNIDSKLSDFDCTQQLLFRWAWLFSYGQFDELTTLYQFSKTDTRFMKEIINWQFDEYALSISIKDLKVSTKELQAYGFFGPDLGHINQLLLLKVRHKELSNTHYALTQFLESYLKQRN